MNGVLLYIACYSAALVQYPTVYLLILIAFLSTFFPLQGTFEFLEENRDDDLCYYLFMVASRELCSSTISAGDVILIM